MNTIAEILKFIEHTLHRHEDFGLVELQARIFVGNQRYVCTTAIKQLPRWLAEHAPHLAIDGGHDRIDEKVAGTSRYLKVGEYLVLQTDSGHAHRVSNIVQAVGALEVTKTLIGTCGAARLVVARQP